MWWNKATIFILKITIVFILFSMGACKKEVTADEAKVKPPVRAYVVTARIDKKGTNSNSEGTAVLKGKYDEDTKILSYAIEYTNVAPLLITLRSGIKGSEGSLVKQLYKLEKENEISAKISGTLLLNPLQERGLLKGLWFVAINTIIMTPEISGRLTLKQL
ncbi:CHRD domain-containing protein [Pedobacter sp.]|uniref:CHRD domain-containing protein n=1 Tax=Pedobacter sp. TaxID=1411316 RepID=UPI003D7F9601